MRILLISSAYNSLTQRVHVELADRGHEVSVELALSDEVMREAVRRFDPDLVIAPMLTTAIPADIWSARPCFIVHPGPRGDRGPSSLDWAIMERCRTLGRHRAAGERGDGRRRHLGQRGVRGAAAARRARCTAPRWRTRRWKRCCWRWRGSRAAATGPSRWTTAVPASPAGSRPPCRQEHRRIDWLTETDVLGAGQAAGGRLPARRARHHRRDRVLPVRRVRGRSAAR